MARGEAKLKLVLDMIDRSVSGVRKANRRIESMTKPIRKVRRQISALSREIGLPKIGAAVGNLARKFQTLAFVGVGALAAVGAAVGRVADQGDELAKFSKQIGTSAEDLQEWEFAADRAGVQSSIFRSSVGALSKRVGELKAGKGALATLLGGSDLARDLKAAKDTGEALEIITAALEEVEDPTKKAALAAAAFSRAGLPMVRLANEGSENIAALRREARRLGLVLSNEDAAAAEKVSDSFTDMKAAATGLLQVIAVDLFPVVREIADGFTEWTVANRELIKVRTVEALDFVVRKGREVVEWLREVIPPTVAFIERIGGLRTVALVLGGAFALTLLPLLVSIGGAIATVSALVGPLGLGLALAAAKIIESWDRIRDSVTGAIDAIISKGKSIVSAIPKPARELMLAVGRGAAQIIAPGASGLAAQGFAAAGALGGDAPISSTASLNGKLRIEVVGDRARVAEAEVSEPGLDLDLASGEIGAPL